MTTLDDPPTHQQHRQGQPGLSGLLTTPRATPRVPAEEVTVATTKPQGHESGLSPPHAQNDPPVPTALPSPVTCAGPHGGCVTTCRDAQRLRESLPPPKHASWWFTHAGTCPLSPSRHIPRSHRLMPWDSRRSGSPKRWPLQQPGELPVAATVRGGSSHVSHRHFWSIFYKTVRGNDAHRRALGEILSFRFSSQRLCRQDGLVS